MKMNNFFLLISFSGMLLFSACEEKPKEVNQTVLNESDSPHSDTSFTQTSQITFDDKAYDFGAIHKGEMVSHVFSFKNSGTNPLVILDAKASCGCTVPVWPKDPIAPGDSSSILVKYNGSGNGQIHKTVTVFANTDPKETVLEITGNVKPIDRDNKGPFKE